jgi:hypothetical protein
VSGPRISRLAASGTGVDFAGALLVPRVYRVQRGKGRASTLLPASQYCTQAATQGPTTPYGHLRPPEHNYGMRTLTEPAMTDPTREVAQSSHLRELVAARVKVAPANSFFGWEHLLLLATPFPVLLIAQVAYILGLDNDARDSIAGTYIWPAFSVSFGSLFIIPTILVLTLLFLIGRNIFVGRPNRLIVYGIVLIVFPIATHWVDADYLRFALQEQTFKTLLANKSSSMPERSAYCFVFDRVVDNFYFGGANVAPYEKFILYASDDVVSRSSPRIDTFLSDTCPTEPVGRIRRLTGRFYLADTFHN